MITMDRKTGVWSTEDGLCPVETDGPRTDFPPGVILGRLEEARVGSPEDTQLASDADYIPCEHVPGVTPDELRRYFKPW